MAEILNALDFSTLREIDRNIANFLKKHGGWLCHRPFWPVDDVPQVVGAIRKPAPASTGRICDFFQDVAGLERLSTTKRARIPAKFKERPAFLVVVYAALNGRMYGFSRYWKGPDALKHSNQERGAEADVNLAVEQRYSPTAQPSSRPVVYHEPHGRKSMNRSKSTLGRP